MPKWPLASHKTMIKTRLLLCIALCSGSLLTAQRAEQASWFTFELNRELSKKVSAEFSQQVRLDRNNTRLRGLYTNADFSYKLGKGWRALAEVRYSTSARWDRIRYGAGLQKRWKLKGKQKAEVRLKGLFQRQFHWLSDPTFGINPPINNYRIKLGYEQKLIPKTRLGVFVEPMWRTERGETFARRFRAGLQLNRALPGPFNVTLGYMWQRNINVIRNFHILQLTLSFNWKKKSGQTETEQ